MLICVFIVLLLWHSAFMQQLNFTYTDEIIALILGIYLVFALITGKYKPEKYERKALYFTIAFYLLGLLATLIHNFQNSIIYGAISGMFSIKTFICFFGVSAYLRNKRISKRSLYRLLRFVEIPLLPVAILLIMDQFVELFPYSDIRYGGLKCSLFIFTHSTELAGFAICSLILVRFLRQILMLKKKYILNYIPAFIMVIISGRYKALGFIMLFVCVDIVLPFIKKFKLRHLAIGIPPAFLIAYDQIMTYFSDLSFTARGQLYKNAFLIAKDYFPFGTGFGTYGTEYSRARYSEIYRLYNMDGIYGLSPRTPYFICDTMWPAVLGEAGLFGFLSIAGILYSIVKIIQKSDISDKKILFLLYALLIYLLIESVAETIFMNPKGCLIFIVLAFMLSVGKAQINSNVNQ